MVPSAIVIPEIQIAAFAGVLHPASILGVLAAVVVVVAGGLCAAIALQGKVPMGRTKPERGSMPALHITRLGRGREDAAAA